MKLIYTVLFAFILLSSCDNKTKNETTFFIGAYRIIDQMVPYPYVIKQSTDSIYLFNNKGMLIEKTKNNGIDNKQIIKFKTKHLKVVNNRGENFYVFDLSDSLTFKPFKNGKPNPKNCAKFTKIQHNIIDIEQLNNDLKNSIWKYNVVEDENSNPNKDLEIKQTIQFKRDSVTFLTDYYYQGVKTVSEHEKKAYAIFNIDGFYFFSFQKEKSNPQPIYQIIDYNSERFELKDFSSKEIKNISFYKDSISSENYTESIENSSYYSNCFDGYQGEYYFGEDVTYNKGNEYLIDYVKTDAPKKDIKSGYIIVHFNINCSGNVGRFGLIQMDRDYKKTLFSKELVKHIFNKVKTLNDFPSSYSQMEWLDYKDVHAFLMFKIHNGKIVDLCP